MKRMFITAVSVLAASAALASPASAMDTSALDAEAWAPCGSDPITTCVAKLLVSDSRTCEPGESVDECAEREIREFDAIGTVFGAVRLIGTVGGQAIVLARDTANQVIVMAWDACDDVISTCDPSDMPLLP